MRDVENKKKKNPNWTPEEIKLILLLYFNTDASWKSSISDKTPEIVALSSILNKLNIHSKESRCENFRSVGSIRMKLTNLRAVDENDKIEGLVNVSSLDRELFKEYKDNSVKLLNECKEILNRKNKIAVTDIEQPYFDIFSDDKDILNEFCRTIYENTLKFRQTAVSFRDFKLSQLAMNLSYDLLSDLSKYSEVELNCAIAEKIDKNMSDKCTVIPDKSAAFVRDEIKKLLNSGISHKELNDFQRAEWCESVLHLNHPLLKAVPYDTDKKDISALCKDENGHRRYWINIFIIRSKKYLVCKEWYTRHVKYISEYLETRKVKQFTTKERIKKIANFIILEDKNAITLDSKKILMNCGDNQETKRILTEMRKIGILKEFNKSEHEYVVEDYDMLYDIIEHPEQYILN